MPTRGLNLGPAFTRLDVDECWRLLESRSFGRICFCVEDRAEVVPSAYVVHARTLYFRTTAFGALARQTRTRQVTLEVDDVTHDRQATWSVTVAGSSEPVVDAATRALLWSPVRPHAWTPGHEPVWIALSADDVQGQRRA